jgi:hypothetical protein
MTATLYVTTVPLTRNRPQSPGATLFHEDWWLNAAAGGHWDCVSAQRDGAVAAVFYSRFGLTRKASAYGQSRQQFVEDLVYG